MAVTSSTSKLCRSARALPAAVLDQCTVCLEEKLYLHAIFLLTNSLTAGSDINAPAYVPPPQYPALLTTLAIHPKLTTGTDERDRHAAADEALRYLRLLADTVDIRESGLRDALKFEDSATGRRASARARNKKSGSGDSDEEQIEKRHIRSSFTALWSRNKDFWAVLGWALNCSVRHKARWQRWKAWLELTLDVLEADIEAVVTASNDEDRMQSTLLAQYLSSIGDSRNNRRRIMRAVTADGSHKSMAEFGEVWAQETRPPEKKADDEDRPFKRQKLDLDNNEFGDYFDDEAEEHEEETRKTKQTRGTSSKCAKQEHAENAENCGILDEIEQFGGMESIRLRQRLLAVLVRFSWIAPKFFMATEELLEVFTEFLRPLPLAVYQQFVLPHKPYLDQDFQVALNEMMFQPLLGLPETKAEITQADFEERFAPSAATSTSAIDNAKVSLLTESILRALWKADRLNGDLQNLRVQVGLGIATRKSKAENGGQKKSEPAKQAEKALKDSGKRMQVLVGMLTG